MVTVAPGSISFGVVKVGNNQSLPGSMTNTGGSTLQVTQVTATGSGFSVSGLSLPVMLAAGQSQGFTVIFTPKAAGTVIGNLAIANTGSTPTVNVTLSGGSTTVGVLNPSPSSLAFGSVQVGGNQTLPETLTNTGGSTITVTQVTPSGTGYSVSGLSLPLALTAGQNQAFSVNFAPAASGSSIGNLAIVSDASNPSVNVALAGNGLAAGALTPNPSSLSFGNVQVGNQQQLSEIVTNTGAVSVSISQATVSGTGFSMSSWAPQVLTAGQHYTFTVTFTPPSPGNYAGSVSIVSNASNPNLSVPLSGAGTPVPQGQLASNAVYPGIWQRDRGNKCATARHAYRERCERDGDVRHFNWRGFCVERPAVISNRHSGGPERPIHGDLHAFGNRSGVGQPFVHQQCFELSGG